MIDFAAYILVKALNKILGFVPISVSLWLGRRIGGIVFVFNKKRRLVAYANLRSAFAREKTPAELKKITRRVYQNMAQTFAEVLNLTKINRGYVDRYVEVVNMDRIRDASKSGRGTILLTAHFGDWELSSLVSSVEGFPILVLAREQKMKRLNELLNRLRESNGCRVIRKGMELKEIVKALRDEKIVGILSDQDAGKSGTFVDFFGRPTSCHAGPMEIAKRTGSIVLPNFIVRTRGPYHKLYLEECIDFSKTDPAGDIKDSLQTFASLLESYVRKYPDQWLWLHKRWKSTPTRTVLVLNDGRAGHLNQSLAVAGHIREARATQGYKDSDTHITVVDVGFRNGLMRACLTHACAPAATWRCHGCMRCVRASLDKNTYDRLITTYADFVVSCGSRLAAVNIFMARENNARNVVIMKPDIFMGLRKFSLALIPRHDNPPKRKNVTATMLAPNLIDDEAMRAGGEILKNKLGLADSDYVGLFIGGDNPEFRLTEGTLSSVAGALLEFCASKGLGLLVTTSRRTSDGAVTSLKKRFGSEPGCKALIIAAEDNPPEAVAGILGLSELVVVSGESISMVSEAVSSGKKVVAFELERRRDRPTKHDASIKGLEAGGYLIVSKADALAEALEKAWAGKAPAKKIDDNEKIFRAIRRIV